MTDGQYRAYLTLLRQGVGRDVKVLRRAAEQRVAHAAADDKGLKAGGLQRREREGHRPGQRDGVHQNSKSQATEALRTSCMRFLTGRWTGWVW